MEPTEPAKPTQSTSLPPSQRTRRRSMPLLRLPSFSSSRTLTPPLRIRSTAEWMADPSVKADYPNLTDAKNLILPLCLDRFLVEKQDFASRHLIRFIRSAHQYRNNPSIALAQQLFDLYLQLPIKSSPLQAKYLVVTPADAEMVEKIKADMHEIAKNGLESKHANLFSECVQTLLSRLDLAAFQQSMSGQFLQEIATLVEGKEVKGKTQSSSFPSKAHQTCDTESLITSHAEQTLLTLQALTREDERTQIDYITWKAERIVEDLFLTHPLVIEAENRLYEALTILTRNMVKEGKTKDNLELWCALAAMLTPDPTLPNAGRIVEDLQHFFTPAIRTLITNQVLTKPLIQELQQLKSEKAKLIELGKRELRCQLAIASLPNRMIEWQSPKGPQLFLNDKLTPCEILPGVKLNSAEDLQLQLRESFLIPFSTFTIRSREQLYTFDLAAQPPEEDPDKRMKACFDGVFDLMVKAGLTNACEQKIPYEALFLKEWKNAQEGLDAHPWLYHIFSFSPSFHKQWEKDIWDEKHGYGMLEGKKAMGKPTLTIDLGSQEITTRYTQTYAASLGQDTAQVDLTISQEFSRKLFFRKGSARMGHLQMKGSSSNLKERERLLKTLTQSPFFTDEFFTSSERYNSRELRVSYVRAQLRKKDET